MKPEPRQPEQDDLLRPRLVDLIDMRHELAKLEALIDWEFFEREWAGFFPSATGRPATSPRLVAGLLYLQHAFDLSDEAVVARCFGGSHAQRDVIDLTLIEAAFRSGQTNLAAALASERVEARHESPLAQLFTRRAAGLAVAA